MPTWESSPADAWRDHIRPHTSDPRWIEDSSDVSGEIGLSKRELFALVVLGHMHGRNGGGWVVGYNSDDTEPNDGYISDGTSKISFEHKVVAQMETRGVLEAILSTYEKYAKRGPAYGGGRVLVVQPNKPSNGLIKISELRRRIQDDCPFDQVYLVSCVKFEDAERTAIMHVTQHFPPPDAGKTPSGWGIAEIVFDLGTGEAAVPHCGIEGV